MKKKDLLIIDLEKNYNFFEKEKKYVSLNKGEINLKDCKKIYISDNLKQKNFFFKLLINKLKKIITKENNFKLFLAEQEIFNLPNAQIGPLLLTSWIFTPFLVTALFFTHNFVRESHSICYRQTMS